MSGELQGLARALASRVRRPVAIDDPKMGLLAHTPHDGQVDEARLESILRLRPPAEAVEWVHGFGIAQANSVVRIPANEDFGLLPRLCAPIRCEDILLGYVWIIDADESLTADDLRIVEETATSAGLVMYRDRLLDDLQRGRQRELLRDLLSDDEPVRRAAAAAVVSGEHLGADGPFVAIVVQVREVQEADELPLTVEAALERASRHLPPGGSVFMARADHGVLVATDRKGVLRTSDGAAGLAKGLRDDLAAATGGTVFAGIGTRSDSLDHVVDSYHQARRAIRVGEIVPGFGPTVAWQDLGVYRVLVQLPLDPLPPDVIHPGLLRLFEVDKGGHLVQTLETYLDHAGDVRSTIAALSVHRTSLYYRLGRIEELGGLRLSDGGERLAVHLGLKLARLSGRFPQRQA
jgi:sugar diacid utilization regulator